MSAVEPTLIREDYALGEMYEHPAFGCISVARTSGGSGTLFMSNVEHQHQIRLTVSHAQMSRTHNQDRHYERNTIVDVAMSQVQFAELMGGMGQGSGVPCTYYVFRDNLPSQASN